MQKSIARAILVQNETLDSQTYLALDHSKRSALESKELLPYSVYMLVCDDGSFYTGYTKNLDARTRLHLNGRGARYTRIHRPRRLVYVEEFSSIGEAMRRERRVKKLTHEQKLELARSRSRRKMHGPPKASNRRRKEP